MKLPKMELNKVYSIGGYKFVKTKYLDRPTDQINYYVLNDRDGGHSWVCREFGVKCAYWIGSEKYTKRMHKKYTDILKNHKFIGLKQSYIT